MKSKAVFFSWLTWCKHRFWTAKKFIKAHCDQRLQEPIPLAQSPKNVWPLKSTLQKDWAMNATSIFLVPFWGGSKCGASGAQQNCVCLKFCVYILYTNKYSDSKCFQDVSATLCVCFFLNFGFFKMFQWCFIGNIDTPPPFLLESYISISFNGAWISDV